jgi:hypothetical protein
MNAEGRVPLYGVPTPLVVFAFFILNSSFTRSVSHGTPNYSRSRGIHNIGVKSKSGNWENGKGGSSKIQKSNFREIPIFDAQVIFGGGDDIAETADCQSAIRRVASLLCYLTCKHYSPRELGREILLD